MNWVLVRATVDPDTEETHLEAAFEGSVDGPVVFGFQDSWVHWDLSTQEPDGVGLVSNLPGVELELTREGGSFSIAFGFHSLGGVIDPDYAAVFWVADATLSSWSVSMSDDGGLVAVEHVVGSGATALRIESAEGVGAGAIARSDARVIAPGVRAIPRDAPVGIAGVLEHNCFIGACVSTWTRPDGHTESVTMTGGVNFSTATGWSQFAGPGGTWTWTYSGVGRDGTIASYAPVGELASLFPQLA